MTDEPITQAEAEDKLWEALEDTRTGMLGLVGGEPQHFQPMTGFEERDGRCIWFFTRGDTDLARDVAGGNRQAMYTLVTKKTDVFACIGGELSISNNRSIIDRFWNPVVAAWYPEGKDDPQLTLVRFDMDEARIWLNDKGPVKFFYEVAKANLTKTLPDAGDKADVTFQ